MSQNVSNLWLPEKLKQCQKSSKLSNVHVTVNCLLSKQKMFRQKQQKFCFQQADDQTEDHGLGHGGLILNVVFYGSLMIYNLHFKIQISTS